MGANTLLACGYMMGACAVASFVKRPLPRRLLWTAPPAIALAFCAAPWGPDGYPMRVAIFTVSQLVFVGLLLARLRHAPDGLRGVPLLRTALVLHTSLVALRAVESLFGAGSNVSGGLILVHGLLFVSNMAVNTAASIGFLMMLNDTVRRRLELQSRTDPLTDVHNRRGLTEVLDATLARAGAHGRPVSLIAFDIDHFKRINDQWGHAAGDRTLAAFAAALRALVRPQDGIGRTGGEEFVVVLPGVDADVASAVAHRLRTRLAEAPIGPQGQPVTFSAGIATSLEAAIAGNAERLLQRADERMYAAKRTRDTIASIAEAAGPADRTGRRDGPSGTDSNAGTRAARGRPSCLVIEAPVTS